MISSFTVSIILLLIWSLAYLCVKKRLVTAKVYFLILGIMASAGVILDLDKYVYYVSQRYDVWNIILFAFLLLLVIIPWMKYDRATRNNQYIINPRYYIAYITILIFFVIFSLITIAYCLPYSLAAMTMGAEFIRNETEGGLLPASFMTTFASAIAALAPIGILFFFIGYTSKKLKKYSYWYLLLPISSVVHSMACAARELYVFLPITFMIMFLFFKNSIHPKSLKRIKTVFLIIGIALISIFMTFTISRFGEYGSDSFISGTWGYIFQQPFVFDQTLQYFDNYKGFSKHLSFFGNILGMSTIKKDLVMSTEWSFGTMYKGFYEMFGYTSLLIGSILYISFFNFMAIISIRFKHSFATLINFSLFIWFTVSGLFYFRYGANSSYFILYMLLMIGSFFIPRRFIITKKKEKKVEEKRRKRNILRPYNYNPYIYYTLNEKKTDKNDSQATK